MEDESVDCPSTVRLSLAHSNLLQKWSAIANDYETNTHLLREIMSIYVSNVAEFEVMAPEIKYFICLGLDEDSRSILDMSSKMLRGDISARSPADKEIMKSRSTILKKVCNLYYRLRNECYPQLKSRFKPPQRAGDPTATEIPRARRSKKKSELCTPMDVVQEPISSIYPSSDIDEEDEDGDNLDDTQAEDDAEEEEEGDTLEDLDHLKRDLGEFGERDNYHHIMNIVSPTLKGKRLGVAGVLSRDECLMGLNLTKINVRSIPISFPPDLTDVFDYIISIPRPDIQLALLTHVIDHDVPFALFLPLNILDIYTIRNPEKHRLNIYIMGSSAWFVGNFSPKKMSGKGGRFTISPLN